MILDEPTSGLDPHQIIEIRELIDELAEKRTVVISTHILQEMEALSQRFIIVDRGNVVADGSLASLRDRVMDTGHLSFRVKENKDDVEPELNRLSGVLAVSGADDDGFSTFTIEHKRGTDLAGEVSRLCAEKHWKLQELRESPASLENVFLKLTKPEAAGALEKENIPEEKGAAS